MKSKKYLAEIDNLLSASRLLKVGFVMMLVWNAYNWTMAQSMQAQTQTIIQPIGGQGMRVQHDSADDNYMKMMARYIANQVGSYTAGSARKQFYELLSLYTPSESVAAKKEFDRAATLIEKYPSVVTVSRLIGNTPIKYNSSKIQINMRKARIISGRESDPETVQVCVSYVIEDARFEVKNIHEKTLEESGNDPDACIRSSNA